MLTLNWSTDFDRLHPWLQQSEFCKYHESKGIHIIQYSPFGNQNAVYEREGIGRLIVRATFTSSNLEHSRLLTTI